MSTKYVGVFCSASDLPENYTEPAKKFASLLVENGFNLVWGGSDTGLMKVMAGGVKEAGGKIVGVSMEILKHAARADADEMIIAPNLSERKALMLTKSDAIAVLPGGIGTLDEMTEMLELKKHGLHSKMIVMLNTEGFYDGLKMQLERMKQEGFIAKELNDLISFADTPEEAIHFLKNS